jgi:hypothetical protein
MAAYYQKVVGTPFTSLGKTLSEGTAHLYQYGSAPLRVPVYTKGGVGKLPNPLRVTQGFFEDAKGDATDVYVSDSYHLIVYDKRGYLVYDSAVVVTKPTDPSLPLLAEQMNGIEQFFARWTNNAP